MQHLRENLHLPVAWVKVGERVTTLGDEGGTGAAVARSMLLAYRVDHRSFDNGGVNSTPSRPLKVLSEQLGAPFVPLVAVEL